MAGLPGNRARVGVGPPLSASGASSGLMGIALVPIRLPPWSLIVAPEGVQYGYKIAKGEKLDAEIDLPTHQVDATNVDEWLGKGF